MLRSVALVLSLLSLTVAQDQLPTEECPLLGPVFPSDFDLVDTDAFAKAKSSFPDLINTLFESGKLNGSISSFAVDVYSAVTNASIYSYFHQATKPISNETFPARGINDGTIFRIGSVSKLYTVYAILAHAGGMEVFDHPVTQYLPELAGNPRDNPLQKIVWEDVTVGTLSSHMAGLGQFPSIPSITACSSPENPLCNATEYLTYMRDVRTPTQPIHQSSLYSDSGFGILGQILQRMTGQTYNEAIQTVLSTPLGLKSTVSIEPKDKDLNAVVIPGGIAVSAWGFDNQISAPSGGLYSNVADFRATGLSILHSKLLSPATTRLWMKPHAHTASLTTSVGAPWEINRLTLPISPNSSRTRVSDLYTKAGGNSGYAAVFALSPDHSLGYSVLVAGETANEDRWPIRSAVGETFLTAAEHAAMEHARRKHAGTFVDEGAAPGSTNLTLTVENDHPGLGLPEFFIDGINALLNAGLMELSESTSGQTVRLYPTGLESSLSSIDGGGKRRQYRAVPVITPLGPRAIIEGGEGLFDDGCIAWENTAASSLGENGQFTDEFILEFDGAGRVKRVVYPVAGRNFTRV